jgi:putative ABC transport system permease protein
MRAALATQLLRGVLASNRLRIALTLACIALGVALAGAVHTIHASALAEVDRAARALSGKAELEIRGPRSGFDDALFARIAARPDVAAASPILELDAALASGGGSVRVLGLDALRALAMQPAFVASPSSTGAGNAATLLDASVAWLSPRSASRLGLARGDRLRLVAGSGTRELEVAGVLAGLEAGVDAVVVDIAAAQAQFDRLGLLSRIEVRLRPGTDQARWRAEVTALLPRGVVIAPAASVAGRAAEITRAYRVNLDALALVALGTGAFLVFSTLALQAARRTQEFALLRALGVTRRELTLLLALEGALLGAAGAAIGTVLALAGSRLLLARGGADLGAGYFAGHGGAFSPDPWGLAGIAAIAIAMAAGGALWVARAVERMPVADALRDRAVDLPQDAAASGRVAIVLALAGLPLLALPALGGLPIAGYGAIGLWLAASVAAVVPLCRALLARATPSAPVAALALAQLRHLPGHLAASVAGIVVSASLCVAMAIMVFSFRVSFEEWLRGVVGADLYVRAAEAGDTDLLTRAEQERIAALPGIARIETLRYDRLLVGAGNTPFTLVARPIDARTLSGFQSEPRGLPERAPSERLVWINEAARDLHGWNAGDRIVLPVAGRPYAARVAGVVRDYARTWGAVLVPAEDYRAATGDERVNDLAIHLAPGADSGAVQAAIRAALPAAPALAIEDSAGIVRRSLEIFDRSFAVTYALEAIAIAIGLAGVTSSFAALAWSRRREFGVLRFMGLTRREILRMLALEGAAAGTLGALVGLASGVAISAVLVHVVNRQSFHWSLELHWPIVPLVLFLAAVIALCALAARLSGAYAVRHEAILAVKDDA